MKKILITTLCLIGLAAAAGLPTYKSASGYGNAATPSVVYFPFDPNSQIRILGVVYSTDTNNSVLSFSTGTTTYYQTVTNVATSSTTNLLNSTNGLSSSATLVLLHAGTHYSSTVSSWFSNTNAAPYGGTGVVLASGGWGVVASPGDEIELMSTASTVPAPAAASGTTTTATFQGEAIYVGNYGRLVKVTISPALTTNQLGSVTAHYDSQSQ